MLFVSDTLTHWIVPLAFPVPRLTLSALIIVGPAPRFKMHWRPLLLADSPMLFVLTLMVLVPSAKVTVTVSVLAPEPPTLKKPVGLFTVKLPVPVIVTVVVELATPAMNGPLTVNVCPALIWVVCVFGETHV